jgi:membrane fusion protein, multidrug efflux system
MVQSAFSRRFRLTGLSIVVLASVIGIVVLGGRSDASSDPEAEHALPLLAGARVTLETGFEIDRAFSGQVMTYQDAGLGFEISGVVDAVLVSEGERVAAGQVLVRLRQAERLSALAEQRAVVAQAVAGVEEAKTRLRLAMLVHERRQQLADREALAPEALETAETEVAGQRARLQSAEATLAHARASLERLGVQLAQTELRAPHAGTVAALPARLGQGLEAGAVAVRLVDLERPYVHVGLPVALAGVLRPGMELQLVVAGVRHPARLASLSPAVDSPTRTVLAVLRPSADAPQLRAGELVRVEIAERVEDPGAWVPARALVEGRRGLWYGYFVQPDGDDGSGVIEPRPLQVVHADAERAYVRGPLVDGELYLHTGLHRAVPGQRVRVILD